MTDLRNIWLTLPSPSPETMDRIGLTWTAAHKCGGVRWANVTYERGGRFDFDDHGEPALIVPAWIDPPSVWRDIDDPILEDLVAVDPDRPRRCATLRGNAAMLGEAALEEARWDRLPLPVFREPVSWLQAASGGVVPLDARRFVNAVSWAPAASLVCRDIDHGDAIDRLIDDALRDDRPKIGVAA